MKKQTSNRRSKYDNAEEITGLGGFTHLASLMHSPEAGYFLCKTLIQKRKKGKWVTISQDEMGDDAEKATGSRFEPHLLIKRGTHRYLDRNKCVSLDHAMRLFLQGWDDDAGFFDSIRALLDRAGVEPLKG